jgi:hypothetical protein
MNLSFLDNIFKPIGKGFAEADTFMNREMPFNMSWGFPAALVASYFAPQIMGSMGSAGGSATGNSMLGSLGLEGGGAFVPTAGNSFSLSSVLPQSGAALGTGNAFGNATGSGQGGLLDYLGLGTESGGQFNPVAGQEGIFDLPSSAYTPEYLDALAKQQGVSQGEPSFFQRLMGNTEQGLYDNLNPQKGLDLAKMGQESNRQSQAQFDEINKARRQEMNLPKGGMKRGEAVDATGALLALLASNQPKTRVPRISLL